MMHKNLIIGAGPAGLAIAGRLSKVQVPFTIVEGASGVGQSWRNHYDRLYLHTVKRFSHLPHVPFSEILPQYVSRADFVQYLEQYCATMEIIPRCNTAVTQIKRAENYWQVITTQSELMAENVIVATGFNRVPIVPTWEGMESFQGEISHSKTYKNPSPFLGNKVLIIGMGNTGAELALDLAEHNVEVSISLRSPINIVPRDFLGNPTQETAMKLQKLPNWLADKVGLLLREITVGNLAKYGIQRPAEAPNAQVRKHGKIPVIDLGTVKLIKQGKIDMKPGVQKFMQQGVIYTNNQLEKFDKVILATGYAAKVNNFIALPTHYLDAKGSPKVTWFSDSELSGLYFIGFNTAHTGILNSIFIESEKVVNHILANQKKTESVNHHG